MIGDRKYDAFGAKDVGIDSLGVFYGHGEESEINGAGFTYTVNSVSEIIKIVG